MQRNTFNKNDLASLVLVSQNEGFGLIPIMSRLL
jgi:hypothetical protein